METAYREFHGVRVPDPFRWLEDAGAPRVRDWVSEQQARTDGFLGGCSELARCREFLERNHPAIDPDWGCRRGDREFALVRRHGAAQPLLVVREAGRERVLLDPNAAGEAIHADDLSVSPSGRWVACTVTPEAGVPSRVRVCDVESGRVVEAGRFITVAPMFVWHPQEQGFFYTLFRRLFDEDDSGDPRRDGLYWHALGADWRADPCIHPYQDRAGHIAFAQFPAGAAHLVVGTFHFSSGRSGFGVCRLEDVDLEGRRPLALKEIFGEIEGFNLLLGFAGGELYFHTCRDAPMGRVVAVDPERPQPAAWRTVVPESELALGRPERFSGPGRSAVGDATLLLTYVRDAHHVLHEHSLDGQRRHVVELPLLCTVDSVRVAGGGFDISAQSFLVPRVVYGYRDGALTERTRVALPEVDLAGCELRQEFYAAKDGVRVPMFLLHRKELPRDGRQATLLYGYGGFNQAITPEYSPEIALWLERGGVYALANIRGGGEYGEAWHRAGSGANKQTTFDDFYAAAEHLIASGYTSPARLAARGLSNGGLLTAVAANQRPDLFAAIVSEVPLVDMLWLDETVAGQSLGSEYGNPFESRAAFELLRSYSPVHNVRAGGPAQMVVVAAEDFSATPGQAYKLVAARQAAAGDDVPVLLRVVAGEGHTGWRPDSTRRALAEEVAFLRQVLVGTRAPDLDDARTPMRDGVMLSANVWLPQVEGRFPAVLLRTPYGNDASEFVRLGLDDYVKAGFAVVIQSVRGRGRSGGKFGFFFAEAHDGYDSVEWVAAQPWCNGRVAMDGGSYLGTAQWLAARERPPHLACILPAVPAGDWFDEIPYMGGALQVDWAFSWLGAIAGLAFDFDETGDRNLEKYRPLIDAGTVLGVELPWYREILAHPTLDAFWRPLQFSAADFAGVTIPVFAVTGWFDGDQAGSLHWWAGLQQNSPAPRALTIGPWEHRDCYLGGSGRVGEMTFGADSVLPIRRLRLEFLRRHLLGEDTPRAPRVTAFLMGENRWLTLDRYPPAAMRVQPWFLGPGTLDPRAASGGPDRYTFDPREPVPYRAGALDHADLEQRQDVLTYSSPPLAAPLTVLGPVELVLHAASSAPDTDFTAKLLDVLPDGRALSLTHVGGALRARYRNGYERPELLTPGEPAELRIRLSHVGHTFLPGHRIRLEVSSSCFPMIDPNTNTGGDFATDTACLVAEQTVFHDRERPSRLLLPVLPSTEGETS